MFALVLVAAALAEPERLYTEWHAGEAAMAAGDYAEAKKRLARAARMRPKDDPDWEASLGRGLDAQMCATDAMLLPEKPAAFEALTRCPWYRVPPPEVRPAATRAELATRLATVDELLAWLPDAPDARVETYTRYAELFADTPAQAAFAAGFVRDLAARDEAHARAFCADAAKKSWRKAEQAACLERFPPPTLAESLAAALAADDLAAAAARIREARADNVDVRALVEPAIARLEAAGRARDASALRAANGDAAAAEVVRIADALALLGDPLSHRASAATLVAIQVIDKARLCPSIHDPKRPPAPPACVAWLRPLIEAWIADGKLDDAALGAKYAGLDFAREWPDAAKRAEAQAAAAKAARKEAGRPYVEAYERLRDRPDAAAIFVQLANRFGHALPFPALVPIAAPRVSVRRDGSLPFSCAALEKVGLGYDLEEIFPAAGATTPVSLTLDGCDFRYEPICTTGTMTIQGATRERYEVGSGGQTYIVRETAADKVLTGEECSEEWYLTARITGRLAGPWMSDPGEALVSSHEAFPKHRVGLREPTEVAAERGLELLLARIRTLDAGLRSALWEPELAAARAAEAAGDDARALEHYGRARRMGAPADPLVAHLVKRWNVPEDVARGTFRD